MVGRSPDNQSEEVSPKDPVTGKPITDSKLNPLVRGLEIDPSEGDPETEDIGPDVITTEPERSREGTQLIVHVEDPDDEDEIDALVAKARGAWKEARKRHGLD